MVKEVIEIDVRTKEGKAKLKELQSGVKDVGTTSKETSKEVGAIGNAADKATGGAISGFKALKGTVTGAIKQFGVLRLAVAATGIGALVLAITAVGKAFTSSEEGQNKFAKIMGVIGAITGNLVDLLADLGEKLISVFENPKQALKDFGNLIKDNIQTRFEGLTELIPQLGKAINLLFKGEFSEAGKVAGNAVAKVALGVDDLSGKIQGAIDKTKEFIAENVNEAKIAAQIADQRAKADKQERALLTERAEANRKIAELREKAADKENVQVEERIAALLEAGRINEEITQKEIEAARLRFEAKKAENALAKSTKEDLDEQAQLEARLIELETARLQKQKSLTAEVTTARREAATEKKAADAEADADQKLKDQQELDQAKALADLKKQIRDAEAVSEDERRELEILKVTEHYDKLIELAKAQGLETVNLEKAKTNAISNLAKQKSENELAWAEMTEEQKLSISKNALNNLSTILGKESAAGKAAAIAAATISTYESATKSYNSLAGIPIIGPALGFAAAGAAIAGGIANVKQIASTKTPNGGGASVPSIQTPRGAGAAAPSFNIVGQGGTNQLAESIGSQEKKPVKAYVVSNDVTTAQSMERNIVESASI